MPKVKSKSKAQPKVEKQTDTWYLYVVRCDDDSLYCGISTDVERRFQEHQSMGAKTAKYLRGRGPLILVYKETIGTRSEAQKAEYEFKQLSKNQKEKILNPSGL